MTPAYRPGARPARPGRGSGALRACGVVLLLLLLAGFALLALLPDGLAHVRLAGVSALWWYGGVVAPVLGWLVAVGCFGRVERADASSPEPGSRARP